MYREGEPDAVTLGIVPGGKLFSVIITHDVDYTRSIDNSLFYAEYEKGENFEVTYFVQTKYVEDYYDEIFCDEVGVERLRQLAHMGMQLGTHTVAHSYAFPSFPLGDGEERYPEYQPFVVDMSRKENATVLDELRVPKFLLDYFVPSQTAVSLRPGHLALPEALPQALEVTGYRLSSSVTANTSLTHFPFQLNFDGRYDQETGVYEFPITFEDEEEIGTSEGLGRRDQLSQYEICGWFLRHSI